MLQRIQKDIVNDFHNLYYDGSNGKGTFLHGLTGWVCSA